MRSPHFAAFERELGGRSFHADQASAIAVDEYCTLYVVSATGEILTGNVRHQLSGNSEEAKASAQASLRRLCPQPQLDPLSSLFAVSGDGSFAAVAGPSTEDRECSALAIIDLRAARAVQEPSSSITCTCSAVDTELFFNRPGLSILQIGWHPGSARHLAVLTSDNAWRLYCLDDLQVAEQTFELQLQSQTGLGLAEEDTEQAVAFAFGRGSGWKRFTVYFLTGSGAVYLLCPAAPFGCLVPQGLGSQLQASCAEDLTTATWLQQALGDAVTPPIASKVASVAVLQAHALTEHVPLLQGPLRVVGPGFAADGLLDLQSQGGSAVSMALTWCTDECGVLNIATAEGLVGWHLLAHEPSPAWGRATPSCIVHGDRICAVNSQVPRSEAGDSGLLLLAAAQLGADDRLRLLVDPCQPSRLFCVGHSCAHLLTAPWVPQLAHQLRSGGEGLRLDVAATSIESLWSATDSGSAIAGAAVVGDALTGTALALAISDGSLLSLKPATPPPSPLPRIAGAGAAERVEEEAETELSAKYGDLLQGPTVDSPATVRVGAGDAQGQKLLSDAIRALNQGHVQFAHRAHDKLLKELEQADAAASGQRPRLDALTKAASELETSNSGLRERLDRASGWNDNLQARVKLLAELHWALPRPPSEAEKRLRTKVLPSLEQEAAQLADTLKGLRKRAQAASGKGQERPQPHASFPPAQAHQLRAALASQSETIGTAQALAAELEEMLRVGREASGESPLPLIKSSS